MKKGTFFDKITGEALHYGPDVGQVYENRLSEGHFWVENVNGFAEKVKWDFVGGSLVNDPKYANNAQARKDRDLRRAEIKTLLDGLYGSHTQIDTNTQIDLMNEFISKYG